MASVKIEFSQFGDFDYFSVVRSESPINTSSMPAPIATNLKSMFYLDESISLNKNYYYIVVAHKDSSTQLSEEVLVYTGGGDAFYAQTVLIIEAKPKNNLDYSSELANEINAPTNIKLVGSTAKVTRALNNNTRTAELRYGYISTTIPQLGLNDFTLEIKFIPTLFGSPEWGRLFQIGANGSYGGFVVARHSSSNPMSLISHTTGSPIDRTFYNETSIFVSNNKYNHICVMRRNGVFYYFINGARVAQVSDATSYPIDQTSLSIGNNLNGTEYLGMVFGSARLSTSAIYDNEGFLYDSNAFELNDTTALLINLNQDVLVDSSTYARNLSVIGLNVSAPNLYESGSIRLDSSSSLSAAITPIGLSDFTSECFVFIHSKPQYYGRLMQFGNNSTDGGIFLVIIPDTYTGVFDLHKNGYKNIAAGYSLPDKSWAHLCVMRRSGIFYLFINGVRIAISNDYLDYSVTPSTIYFGANDYNSEQADISLSGVRLTLAARYSVSGFDRPSSKYYTEV